MSTTSKNLYFDRSIDIFPTFISLAGNLTFVSIINKYNLNTGVQSMPPCKISEVYGDLFTAAETCSLAHCVAADMKLSRGIAVKFRNKFGQISRLKLQNVKPGGVAILQDRTRFIYYLVTKEFFWNKPTYQTLQASLQSMKTHMLQNNINKLAIPRLGCGLDGLEWHRVRNILEKVFKDIVVEITVYHY